MLEESQVPKHCEFCELAGNEQPKTDHFHCDVCGICTEVGKLFCPRCETKIWRAP